MLSLQIPLRVFHITFFRKKIFRVKNPYVYSMDEDILYHMDLGRKTQSTSKVWGCNGKSISNFRKND